MFKTKKLEVKEVVSLYNGVSSLISSSDEQGVKASTGYKLSRWLKELEPIVKSYEEQRIKALEKYGKDQGDGQFSIEKENIKLLEDELKSIYEAKESVKVLESKIKFSEIEDLKVSPSYLALLDDYIDVE